MLNEPEWGCRGNPQPGYDMPEKNGADIVRESAVPQSRLPQEVQIVATSFAAAPLNHTTDGSNGSGEIVHVKHFALNRAAW